MTVYVLNPDKGYGKKFVELCGKIQINSYATTDDFIKAGFTNYHEPSLYFSRPIKEDDKYPVSFSILVDKKSLKIKEFNLLDENFLQPHFCNREEYEQIEQYTNMLVKKGILKRN
ncbi:MAG: hypothetical protein K6C05_10860 [Anaerovibrio sp.]|uniref:hypothetical protein n=1 Tax=Anaerovibrio sp. TaxID=1872532 RepID=UPI0025D01C59|nr:hypothetical protein [Anaerovibrio sp.]MCR5177327.1 hypothetical protein [Anaerovibrio sp.]